MPSALFVVTFKNFDFESFANFAQANLELEILLPLPPTSTS
jgi:hypothetical protein